MSAPSFSSFSPSFASFPDLDPGPSRHKSSPTRNETTPTVLGYQEKDKKDKKDKSQRRSKKSKDESRNDKRHKTTKYDPEPVDSKEHKHAWKGASIPDDEKLKAEEDRRLAQTDPQESQ